MEFNCEVQPQPHPSFPQCHDHMPATRTHNYRRTSQCMNTCTHACSGLEAMTMTMAGHCHTPPHTANTTTTHSQDMQPIKVGWEPTHPW
jgi:hypothetical protein